MTKCCGCPDGDKVALHDACGTTTRETNWGPGLIVRLRAKIAGLAAVFAPGLFLGACALPDMDSFKAPDSSAFFRQYSMSGVKEKQLKAVTSEDLVDPEGRCAFASAAAPAEPGAVQTDAAPGVPLVPQGVSLEMTECEVVKRIGPAERAEIGSNGSERTAVLTYIRGGRPGIYHFVGGRLSSIERAPEPPAPPKAAPRKPAPKPKARTAQSPT